MSNNLKVTKESARLVIQMILATSITSAFHNEAVDLFVQCYSILNAPPDTEVPDDDGTPPTNRP